MARFLTPSKIGLLALIELYTDASAPTSFSVPILSFILNQLLPSSLPKCYLKEPNLPSIPFVLTLKSFEILLAAEDAASDLPGQKLWNHFLHKLWDINSLHALHVFFDRRSNLLAKTKEESRKDADMGIPPPGEGMIVLSRTSPLGSFIRRAKVEFERLRFSDVLMLWTAFVKWRQEGTRGLEMEWGQEGSDILQLVAYGDLTQNDDGATSVGTDDLEKLLEFQVEQMQKLGSRIPLEVRDRFKDVLNESVLTPSLSHYLNFLDSWRAGDYPTSFDNLHRYFDYTMQNRDRLLYQYALMNLAVLQADFGCCDEAVAAMLETVSTARENKDMACLNFSLNWLYHFGKSHPKVVKGTESTNMLGVEREGLSFLRVKAKESGMWTLWSSSLLSEAKLGMSNGESASITFENILKSSHLTVEKNLKSMMGSQMAISSSFWGRLGVTQLARQYCDIFLSCHAIYGSFDDTLRFTCRVAHLLVEKGRYNEAFERLEALDENSLRSWKANQHWVKYCGILRLKRDLRMNNLDGAERLLAQLLQCNEPDADPDLMVEINVLHIDYLIRRTDFLGALVKIETLSSIMKEDGDDINLRLKLLVMKALLQEKSGRPQKGFSIAIRAASIAWRARIIPSLWAAMGAIACILTSMSEFEASSSILTSIIPRALECHDSALSSQLHSFLADAHMGLAGQAEAGSSRRTESLSAALKNIDRAFAEFSQIEEMKGQCEMMAKKAAVMRFMGNKLEANDCASRYLDLKRQAGQVGSLSA